MEANVVQVGDSLTVRIGNYWFVNTKLTADCFSSPIEYRGFVIASPNKSGRGNPFLLPSPILDGLPRSNAPVHEHLSVYRYFTSFHNYY